MNSRLINNFRYAGVYAIVNRRNGKRYIGSSKDISSRIAQHKKLLQAGTHYNKQLQYDYDKKHSFYFEILYVEVLCPKNKYINNSRLHQLERKFIEEYNTIENGYNICISYSHTLSMDAAKRFTPSSFFQ